MYALQGNTLKSYYDCQKYIAYDSSYLKLMFYLIVASFPLSNQFFSQNRNYLGALSLYIVCI